MVVLLVSVDIFVLITSSFIFFSPICYFFLSVFYDLFFPTQLNREEEEEEEEEEGKVVVVRSWEG